VSQLSNVHSSGSKKDELSAPKRSGSPAQSCGHRGCQSTAAAVVADGAARHIAAGPVPRRVHLVRWAFQKAPRPAAVRSRAGTRTGADVPRDQSSRCSSPRTSYWSAQYRRASHSTRSTLATGTATTCTALGSQTVGWKNIRQGKMCRGRTSGRKDTRWEIPAHFLQHTQMQVACVWSKRWVRINVRLRRLLNSRRWRRRRNYHSLLSPIGTAIRRHTVDHQLVQYSSFPYHRFCSFTCITSFLGSTS